MARINRGAASNIARGHYLARSNRLDAKFASFVISTAIQLITDDVGADESGARAHETTNRRLDHGSPVAGCSRAADTGPWLIAQQQQQQRRVEMMR